MKTRLLIIIEIFMMGIMLLPVYAQYMGNTSNEPEISFPTVRFDSIQKLDTVFELQPQQYAEFPDENLKITFLQVREDSRCPVDVTCIWQGNVGLEFAISQVQNISITLRNDNNPVSVFGKYQIYLIDVKPYPVSSSAIKLDDYIAFLKITKTDTGMLSPLKQFRSGIIINEILCQNDLHVLTARPNGKIACVSELTAERLGWKIINPDLHDTSVFEVSKADDVFDVEYSINGGMIQDMTFDTGANSLMIEIDSSSVGILTVEIPRDLLDVKSDYCPPKSDNPPDDRFFVLLDGEEIMFDEISTTNQTRTLKMHFLPYTSKIEITEACLI